MITLPQIDKPLDFSLVYYENPEDTVKGRISFTQNVFSFLVEGYKEIYSQTSRFLSDKEFALIASPNCLMTEKRATLDRTYKSILFFFSDNALNEFRLTYHDLIFKNTAVGENTSDVLTFPYDSYCDNFRNSLKLLVENNQSLNGELLCVKFNEIMLYLLKKYPKETCRLLNSNKLELEIKFKAIIENNAYNRLDLEEFAFLCNMSLSTFKRHFKFYYKTSPQKYFLSKRMQMAKYLLERGELPVNIYSKVGYQTLSNFVKAYKAYYNQPE